MEKINKKEISEKTAIKAIITGFVSYGILISFIFSIFAICLIYLTNKISNSNELTFKIVLTFIVTILLYITIHLICKMSNIDLFKKCKFDRNQEAFVCKRMNLFYLLCILFFVLLTISSLFFRFESQLNTIELSYRRNLSDFNYSNLGYAFAENSKKSDLKDFYASRNTTLIIATIIELGTIYSFISLIPYQKKMLNLYNTDK